MGDDVIDPNISPDDPFRCGAAIDLDTVIVGIPTGGDVTTGGCTGIGANIHGQSPEVAGDRVPTANGELPRALHINSPIVPCVASYGLVGYTWVGTVPKPYTCLAVLNGVGRGKSR